MSTLFASAVLVLSSSLGTDAPVGVWRAWLDAPGGELPFGISVESDGGGLSAALVNGNERIAIPHTTLEGNRLVLDMPHYDSRIEADLSDGELHGTWRKRSGSESWTEMPFHARRGPEPRFPIEAAAGDDGSRLDGRWRVDFESSEDSAVGIFETEPDGTLAGTFLTSTGDYRFLAGDFAGDRMRLSCFDGAHAFLFTAVLRPDGGLSGHFWSRDTWHETWTAVRDDAAALPDPYEQTEWRSEWDLGDAVFPDIDGTPRSLADPAFAGRAQMLVAFGTWCPNCHDEAPYLRELHERYGPRGLSILGLAFELTGDFERDAEQVRRFAKRHGTEYPILVAGLANKTKATRAFPMLDFVRSYPTTIFLHGDGRVRAVHSGFTGPATGEAHDTVRAEFEGLIEELLAEEPPSHDDVWEFLEGRTFQPLDGKISWVFSAGVERLVWEDRGWRIGHDQAVRLSRGSVFFENEVLRIDREAGILFDPRDFGVRFTPEGSSSTPSIDETLLENEQALAVIARNGAPVARREAFVAISELRRRNGEVGNPTALEYVGDPSVGVALAAVWSIGRNREQGAVPVLLEHLSDPNAALRRESAHALGRIGVRTPSVLEALDALYDDPDPLVRAARMNALSALGG